MTEQIVEVKDRNGEPLFTVTSRNIGSWKTITWEHARPFLEAELHNVLLEYSFNSLSSDTKKEILSKLSWFARWQIADIYFDNNGKLETYAVRFLSKKDEPAIL